MALALIETHGADPEAKNWVRPSGWGVARWWGRGRGRVRARARARARVRVRVRVRSRNTLVRVKG